MNRLFFNQQYIFYIGASFDTVLHRHHAAQICIGLEKSFKLFNAVGEVESHRAAIIDANAYHKLSAPDTKIASLYLDVQSETYGTLLKQTSLEKNQSFLPLQISEELLSDLIQLHRSTGKNDSATLLLNKLFQDLTDKPRLSHRVDKRVLKVLEYLNQSNDSRVPLEELAASVHLSSSRLAHLFKSEVGTPIRRYSLWARIQTAIKYAIAHQSLTYGAHHAGFTDSAHFSRMFKEMFGINPSKIVNKQFPITVTFD